MAATVTTTTTASTQSSIDIPSTASIDEWRRVADILGIPRDGVLSRIQELCFKQLLECAQQGEWKIFRDINKEIDGGVRELTNYTGQTVLDRLVINRDKTTIERAIKAKMVRFLGSTTTAERLAEKHHHHDIVSVLYNFRYPQDGNTQTPPLRNRSIRYLVFKGGGPKGIAYIGAIEALERQGLLDKIKGVAGTSAGSIVACLLAVGYTTSQMRTSLNAMDLTDFLDKERSCMAGRGVLKRVTGVIKGLGRFFGAVPKALAGSMRSPSEALIEMCVTVTNLKDIQGVCKGEKFRAWIETCIRVQTGCENCTFGELSQLIEERGHVSRYSGRYRHLKVFTISSESGSVEFSTECKESRDYVISDVIRASMAIPVVFRPHQLRKKLQNGSLEVQTDQWYVDGGICCNFPMYAFDKKGRRNKETLGFDLISACTVVNADTTPDCNLLEVANLAVNQYLSVEGTVSQKYERGINRIVQIDIGDVGLLSFELTPEQKETLISSGDEAVQAHLRKYGINRPPCSIYDNSIPLEALRDEVNHLGSVLTDDEIQGSDSRYLITNFNNRCYASCLTKIDTLLLNLSQNVSQKSREKIEWLKRFQIRCFVELGNRAFSQRTDSDARAYYRNVFDTCKEILAARSAPGWLKQIYRFAKEVEGPEAVLNLEKELFTSQDSDSSSDAEVEIAV